MGSEVHTTNLDLNYAHEDLHISKINTETYGNKSIKHHCATLWNKTSKNGIAIISDPYKNLAVTDIKSNHLCLEVQFILIPNSIVTNLRSYFKKKHITINNIYNSSYIKSLHYKKYFEQFYVRSGAQSRPLNTREAIDYVTIHFPNAGRR